MQFLFNGEHFESQSNIKHAIEEVKPAQLHTEMYVTIKDGSNLIERKLNLIQGKKLFNDEMFREIFINNLLLT